MRAAEEGVMRVLMVEDEAQLAQALARGLRRLGFVVDVALDGKSALRKAQLVDYDAILLDRDLPGVHGDDVCRRLTADGCSARILMLTAAAELDEIVGGLDLGADDYMVKPVRLAELAARLRALGRRQARASPALLRHGDLELDPGRLLASRAGRQLTLTPKEFAVLELLMRAEGRLVSAEELLFRAWDENADPFTSSVRVIVSRLRRALGDPPLITTVPGRGYSLRSV
jgi:DNA-binding response OmpR family regulator